MRKISFKIFILTLLLIIVFPSFYKTQARVALKCTAAADWGYTKVMGYDWDKLDSYEYAEGGSYSNGVKKWKCDDQIQCLEGSNTRTGSRILIAILDINPDGDNPDGGRICVGGTWRDLSNNPLNAKMAYMCYFAEKTGKHESNGGSTGRAEYEWFKLPFAYFWQYGGYRDYLSAYCNDLPLVIESISASRVTSKTCYTESDNYMNTYQTSDKQYQSRMLIVGNGGDSQSRSIVFGKQVKASPIKIEKYITKVEGVSDSALNQNLGDQRKIGNGTIGSESDKETKPVKSSANVKVTYKIILKNSGTSVVKGTLTDEPDEGLFIKSSMSWQRRNPVWNYYDTGK